MKRRGVENASQDALQNPSKMAPRRLGNGFKMAPGGLPGASREPKLIFDSFLASVESLLDASWGALGVVLGPLGPLPSPPGPLLGVILASGRSLFRAFWEVFLEAGPGAFKNHVFRFVFAFLYAVWVLLLILSCLPPGDPGGQANFEKL